MSDFVYTDFPRLAKVFPDVWREYLDHQDKLALVKTNKQFYDWEQEEKMIVAKAQMAFYDDTKEYNSESVCRSVSIHALKHLVEN